MVEVTLPPGMSPEDFERLLKKETKKAKSSGEDYVEFAKVDYGTGDELRVYRDIYVDRKGQEHETLSVRRFYTDKDDGTLKPGKGVTLHYEDIDTIIDGLEKMKEWLEENTSTKHTKRLEQGDT